MSDKKAVIAAALALPERERWEVLEAIEGSFPHPPDPAGDADLEAELRRRADDVDAGREQTLPWTEVRRRIESREGV